MAEAYCTPLAPHNPRCPWSLAASIPNFRIQERGDNEYADLLAKPLPQAGDPRPYRAQFDEDDGSVIDW